MVQKAKTPTPWGRTKNFGGKSLEEVHAQALNKPCVGCKAPASVQIKVFAPLEDVDSWQAGLLAMANGGELPIADTISGQYVRMSMAAVCAKCLPAASAVAAQAPSTWFADFDMPPPEKLVLGVTDR